MNDTHLQMIQSRDHPHYGELGWLERDTLQHTTGQFYFKLSNCQHGVAGCYVLEADLTSPDTTISTNSTTTEIEVDPYKYNDVTVAKLVQAFSKSYNITEACQYAGIDRKTYYNWLEQIPEFEPIVEEAKSQPLKEAKDKITAAIKSGDMATVRWYVERRDPEFKPKSEVDNTHELKETRRKLGSILDERTTNDFGEESLTATGQVSGTEISSDPTDIS